MFKPGTTESNCVKCPGSVEIELLKQPQLHSYVSDQGTSVPRSTKKMSNKSGNRMACAGNSDFANARKGGNFVTRQGGTSKLNSARKQTGSGGNRQYTSRKACWECDFTNHLARECPSKEGRSQTNPKKCQHAPTRHKCDVR